MFFYRSLNIAVMAAEMYFFVLIQNESVVPNNALSTIGLCGKILLFVNITLGLIFLMGEMFLSRESPTLIRLKASYAYTETPVKIALLFTIGVSETCNYSDSNFSALQLLLRLDLIFSYISYAWTTLWPIIILPVNKMLACINSIVIYPIRIVRGTPLCFSYLFDSNLCILLICAIGWLH